MNPSPSELKEKLAPVFERFRDRIVAVYLFGSTAKGEETPKSDIDLAVLLRGRDDADFDLKLDLYADCCRVLKRNDIDVVILNRTGNLFLIDDIVCNGFVLFDADPEVREEYEVKMHHDFIDFRDHRMRIMGV